jgi:hypothetical protein
MKKCFLFLSLILISSIFSFIPNQNKENQESNQNYLHQSNLIQEQLYINQINSTHFSCDNNKKILPLEKFNDDFCDCEDGSDENKTNACNNGKFYCNNYLYLKKIIPTSKLNDGVCDCCDGSDEPNLNCPNECLFLSNIEYKKYVSEFEIVKSTLDSYSEESTKEYFSDTFSYIYEINSSYHELKKLYEDKILIERYVNSKNIYKDESKISKGDLNNILSIINKKIDKYKKDLTDEEDNIHSLISMGAFSELLGDNKLKLNFEDYNCELTKNKFHCRGQFKNTKYKNKLDNLNFGQLSYINNNVAIFNQGYDCKGYPGVSLSAEIIFLCGKKDLFMLNYVDNLCFYSFFYYTYLACNNAQINNIMNKIDDLINH